MNRRPRSRRSARFRDDTRDRPLYARVLRLRHLRPNGVLCFVYFEGAIILAVLLALAELVSWWGVLVLPACIALMVKVNDLTVSPPADPPTRRPDSPRQRSASRRDASGGAAVERPPADAPAAVDPADDRGVDPASPSPAVVVDQPGRPVAPAPRQVPGVDADAAGPASAVAAFAPARPLEALGHQPTVQTGAEVAAASGPRGDAPPANIHPVARQLGDRGEQFNAREQWARQSGRRRYE